MISFSTRSPKEAMESIETYRRISSSFHDKLSRVLDDALKSEESDSEIDRYFNMIAVRAIYSFIMSEHNHFGGMLKRDVRETLKRASENL